VKKIKSQNGESDNQKAFFLLSNGTWFVTCKFTKRLVGSTIKTFESVRLNFGKIGVEGRKSGGHGGGFQYCYWKSTDFG